MSPWEAIIEKVPEGCRTLLAAAAALAMTMMATMLALTADAHVLALVDDLLRENVQRLDLLGRQGRQDAIGYLVLALPQNQPNAPLYPAGGAPGSRPGALPHFGRPRYLGPPPRARSTAG